MRAFLSTGLRRDWLSPLATFRDRVADANDFEKIEAGGVEVCTPLQRAVSPQYAREDQASDLGLGPLIRASTDFGL